MEKQIGLDAWLMLCIAPCVITWILGSLRRLLRARANSVDREPPIPDVQPLMFTAPPPRSRHTDSFDLRADLALPGVVGFRPKLSSSQPDLPTPCGMGAAESGISGKTSNSPRMRASELTAQQG